MRDVEGSFIGKINGQIYVFSGQSSSVTQDSIPLNESVFAIT